MKINPHRRTLLRLATLSPLLSLSPFAQAASRLITVPTDRPLDDIRRVFDEVLTSPRQRMIERERGDV